MASLKALSVVLLLSLNALCSAAAGQRAHCVKEPIPPLEPVTQAYVDSGAGGTPIYKLSYSAARASLEAAQAPGSPSLDTVDYKELEIPVGPTGSVNIHVFRPLGTSNKTLPVIVYFHGGGWILGSPKTHRRLVLDLVFETDAAVFFVNYTRAPEAQFPVLIQQAQAAIAWLHEYGYKELNLDHQRIAFAGDSVGGGMSAAVNFLSLQKGRRDLVPKFQALFYPLTDTSKESCTYQTFFDGPGLQVKTLRWMINAFAPNKSDRKSVLASPLLASDGLLKQLPETLVMVAEVDPLRQEGEEFARRLSAAGVRTTVVRVEGTVHDFVMLNGLAQTPAARLAVQVAGLYLKKALLGA
ncbi:esterase/lipase [Sphaerosporella brunnea]|uniref:Esterase/lipase n=1 Tax=Sphaerosporella brunnea TaxID=1250544 RepID=A0A5J5EHL3_9PEZI|nr:esterase/lipase [Sphaerosporella brunnea]